MSKRVIIVENCEDCPNSGLGFLRPEYVCLKMFDREHGERFCPKEDTPDWCPLPDLPERRENCEVIGYTVDNPITEKLADALIDFGFNECLDIIVWGEEE